MDRLSPAELLRWAPIRVYWEHAQPMVDWCYLGEERFSDPFFEQTIRRCLRHPFQLLFRHQTSIELLSELHQQQPGLPPSGFIFHMSRCGSTLVAQMLAAQPEHIVISEAGPVDTVLRSALRDPRITDEQRIRWLQGLLNTYSLACGGVRRLFVKFDSWSVFELPLIRRAFPNVPWIFLYRDPLEVLVSHARERGSQMLPGMLEPGLLGLDQAALARLTLDEYGAHVLARVCAAAIEHYRLGQGRLVHYGQLPDLAWLPGGLFGLGWTSRQIDRMRDVAAFHAKHSYHTFEQDSEAKRRAATLELRTLAEQWLEPWYQQLETLRVQEASTPLFTL